MSGSNRDQILTFETNVGDKTVAASNSPINVRRDPTTGEPSPYVRVRANLDALIDRMSFYRLVDLGSHHEVEGDSWFGVWSSGEFFKVIPSKELTDEI